jgi:hypothetical protein
MEWFIDVTRVDAPDYRFVRKQIKPALKKATRAAALRRVGWDFRATLWTRS